MYKIKLGMGLTLFFGGHDGHLMDMMCGTRRWKNIYQTAKLERYR